MPRVYIIGATIGFPMLNLNQFQKAAEKIGKMGYSNVVPHYLFHDEENNRGGLSFSESLKRRQEALEECEYAVLLPGFAEDRYASCEAITAKNLSIPRIRFDEIKQKLPCLK